MSTVSITDNAGNQEAVPGIGVHWLRSNAIVRLATGLTSSPVEYRVTEVPLGGQNAVNQGQQRFMVSSPQTVTIGLLAFNLVVQGRDALARVFPCGLPGPPSRTRPEAGACLTWMPVRASRRCSLAANIRIAR